MVAVLASVTGSGTRSGTPTPADTSTSTDAVGVSMLPLDPLGDAQQQVDACHRLAAELPERLDGRRRRDTVPSSERVLVWGADPSILLRCGVPAPPGFVQGVQTVVVDQVAWYQQLEGPVVVWTTVDRAVRVSLTVPVSVPGQGGLLSRLAPAVQTLPSAPVAPLPLPPPVPTPSG